MLQKILAQSRKIGRRFIPILATLACSLTPSFQVLGQHESSQVTPEKEAIQLAQATEIATWSQKTISELWTLTRPEVPDSDANKLEEEMGLYAKSTSPKMRFVPMKGRGLRILFDGNPGLVQEMNMRPQFSISINGHSLTLTPKSGLIEVLSEIRSLHGLTTNPKNGPSQDSASLIQFDKSSLLPRILYYNWYSKVVNAASATASVSDSVRQCQAREDFQYEICWTKLSTFLDNKASFINEINRQQVAFSEIQSAIQGLTEDYKQKSCMSADSSSPNFKECQKTSKRLTRLRTLKSTDVTSDSLGDSISNWSEKNKSWLKPAAIVAGLAAFTFAVCKIGKVKKLGCGKKKTTLTTTTTLAQQYGLPTSDLPSAPLYTEGVGTR